MRILLDTHVLVWWARDDPRLGGDARDAIRTATHAGVSIVTAWEIAIKRSLGKLEAPADLVDVLLGAGAAPAPITLAHAATVERLPHHHRDPFDRLLVAQAIVEQAAIVTADPELRAYDIAVVW